MLKIVKILKWTKIIAKLTAIGTTITGAVTALTSTSVTTGFAIGAVGATSYAAARNIPIHSYEKTAHVSPRMSKSSGGHAIMNYSVQLGASASKPADMAPSSISTRKSGPAAQYMRRTSKH